MRTDVRHTVTSAIDVRSDLSLRSIALGTHYEGLPREKRALSAFINLVRAAESLIARQSRRTTSRGLTISQFGVLETLHHLGPLCQKELSKKLLRSGGNITMVVDNLERNGLVRRVRGRSDRRFVTVHLSAKGSRIIQDVLPDQIRGIVDDMSVLNASDLNNLRTMCRKLGRNTKE